MRALFEINDLRDATERLRQAAFPETEAAQELQSLPIQEPYWAYTVAASETLRTADPAPLVARLIDRIGEWVDEALTEGPQPVKVACQLGCHFCCFIRVNVLAPEVKATARAIPTEKRAAVTKRIETFIREASALDAKTRFLKPMLCPLNEEGLCVVYNERPLACRSHHSFSRDECEASFKNWEDDLPITRHTVRKVCCEAAIEGFADALAFLGQDNRPLELAEALQIALAGRDDFNAAFRPDIG